MRSRYLPGDIGAVTGLHAAYYGPRWGFGLYFEAKVALGLAEFLGRFRPGCDGFWVAAAGRRVVGAIAIVGPKRAGGSARLRWFIVDPACQGRGVGARLLAKALLFCRRAGHRRVTLSTFAGLDAARRLYEKRGFVLTREERGNTWGVPVTEQTFELIFGKRKFPPRRR